MTAPPTQVPQHKPERASPAPPAGAPAAAIAAALLSAALVWFGMGLHPAWPLAWLAPIPILLAGFTVRGWACFLCAATAVALGGLSSWTYLSEVIRLPWFVIAAVLLLPAVIFALCAVLARALIVRGDVLWGLIAFPSAWVTFEYLGLLFSPNGTFGSIAYTQSDFLPIVQLAAVGGVLLVSFVVLFVAVAAAATVYQRLRGGRWRMTLAALVAVLAGACGYGLLRLNAPIAGERIEVGQIAQDAGHVKSLDGDPDLTRSVIAGYARQVDAVGARGARIVVLPEEVAGVQPQDLGQVEEIVANAARRNHLTLIAGLRLLGTPKGQNVALVFRPDGAVLRPYQKHHLVPVWESERLEAGTGILLVDDTASRWGVQICKDLDFPDLSATYGRERTGLMLVPAWDFGDDAWMHSRMAVMRGVEQGFSIVRTAADGLLTVSDDRGRILAQLDSGTVPFALGLSEVRVQRDATPYGAWGDWPGPVCVALTLMALARLSLSALGPRKT